MRNFIALNKILIKIKKTLFKKIEKFIDKLTNDDKHVNNYIIIKTRNIIYKKIIL